VVVRTRPNATGERLAHGLGLFREKLSRPDFRPTTDISANGFATVDLPVATYKCAIGTSHSHLSYRRFLVTA
jgi:hypothetical protein